MSKHAEAEIEFTQAINARGYEQDCVVAVCVETDDCTPREYLAEDEAPIWGHSGKSVRRALALLSDICSCGARWHKATEGEDEEDRD